MNNWKTLMTAVALTLGWIMADPAMATGPAPEGDRQVEMQLMVVARVDSLLAQLRRQPDDVNAMEQLAGAYIANESYDAAIGPLARALQLEPGRRSLWTALDKAVRKSGRGMITDAELTNRAVAFQKSLKD